MKRKISPYLIIICSFLALILIGTLLFVLPISTHSGYHLTWIDSFFLAVSGVTITGVSPVADLALTLTPFGKTVLLILVQIGGLSVVTLSIFVMIIFGAKIGLSNRVLIKESLNQTHLSGMVKLVRKIVFTTLLIEFMGVLIHFIIFLSIYPAHEALGMSIFHTISSFNHAGFNILDAKGQALYDSNWFFSLNTAFLIMLGSLGFIVIHDIIEKKSYRRLTIHSKIVIKVNLFLWTTGFLLFKFSQIDLESFTWMQTFFLSVNSRTAGFNTLQMADLSQLTMLIMICLMFIGGSPSSAAGGIKTTTFYTVFKSVFSYATGKKATTHERYISDESKYKSLILISSSLAVIVFAMVCLMIFDKIPLDLALFQSVSVFSNTGFSVIDIKNLSSASEVILAIVMILGRVGMLTVLLAFNKNWHQKKQKVNYIEERILIG